MALTARNTLKSVVIDLCVRANFFFKSSFTKQCLLSYSAEFQISSNTGQITHVICLLPCLLSYVINVINMSTTACPYMGTTCQLLLVRTSGNIIICSVPVCLQAYTVHLYSPSTRPTEHIFSDMKTLSPSFSFL